MSFYRFLPHKGLRRRGQPYGKFETDISEIDEEWFESREEFVNEIAQRIYQVLEEEDEV